MEKTLISYNIPNFVTINAMAWIGFLALVLIWQFVFRRGDEQEG